MTTVRSLQILGAITSLWLAGCAGASEESEPLTRGAYCNATGEAYCKRVEACEIDKKASCLQEFTRSCCATEAICKQLAKDPVRVRALQDQCVPALSALSCEDVAAAVVPSACSSAP